jgi:hypothetical protein
LGDAPIDLLVVDETEAAAVAVLGGSFSEDAARSIALGYGCTQDPGR